MPIHEKSLIRPENVHVQDKLVLDGIDVSGHWSTFIESRVVADYNERRPHQGRWCFGKTPMQSFLDALPLAKEKLMAA